RRGSPLASPPSTTSPSRRRTRSSPSETGSVRRARSSAATPTSSSTPSRSSPASARTSRRWRAGRRPSAVGPPNCAATAWRAAPRRCSTAWAPWPSRGSAASTSSAWTSATSTTSSSSPPRCCRTCRGPRERRATPPAGRAAPGLLGGRPAGGRGPRRRARRRGGAGLGASGPQVVEGWYGRPYPRPLERTREYVDIVRQVLRREGPVRAQGRHYRLPLDGEGTTGEGKALRATVHPRRPDLPIHLAAQGPRNVALAAAIADRRLPPFFSPRL